MKNHNLFVGTNLPEPLEIAELYDLFEKMKQGDRIARDEIIRHNIRLVINEVTKRFPNTSYDSKELVSVGFIGLIKSVDTFDTTKGFQFATYSKRCIENEILMFMRKEKKYIHVASLEQPIVTDEEGKELKVEDTLMDINSDFVSEYENNNLYKVIRNIVNALPERDKNIVLKYFGFEGNNPMTQRKIADELGVSKQRVSELVLKNIREIGKQLQKSGKIDDDLSFVLNKKRTKSHLNKNR